MENCFNCFVVLYIVTTVFRSILDLIFGEIVHDFKLASLPIC